MGGQVDERIPDARSPFHRGERAIHARLGVRDEAEARGRRLILDHVSEQQESFFAQLPHLMVGTVDADGRPWASMLIGRPRPAASISTSA